MRVQLVESAKLAFYEYFLVDRAIAVNDEGLRLLGEFKQNAESRYKTGLAPQQDMLQAEVEIGRQRERAVTLEEAALKLALREYYPDVELAAAYDTIMGNGPMRDLAPQVGLRMNLPVRVGKRNGAVAEAQAKIAQRHAEYASRVNQVQFQVQEAYEHCSKVNV
jgi:outer membrane protein TolC